MAKKSKHPKKVTAKTKSSTKKAVQKKATKTAPDPEKLKTLKKYEKEIKEGIIKYYEMGALLQKIRDEKLYELRGCNSFSEYCKKVFNYGRAYGYRLIAYCRVWNLIKEKGDQQIPEHVIRSLSSLKTDEEIKQCWEEAKEKAGNTLPHYKEIEALVKEKKCLNMMESKGFDPHKKSGEIFLTSLRCSVSRKDVAAGIIDASNNSFRKIYNSIKEAQNQGISFTEGEEKKLRNALMESLDSIFGNGDTED